jgi:hypothetical protein
MLWFPEIHEVFVCSHGQKKNIVVALKTPWFKRITLFFFQFCSSWKRVNPKTKRGAAWLQWAPPRRNGRGRFVRSSLWADVGLLLWAARGGRQQRVRTRWVLTTHARTHQVKTYSIGLPAKANGYGIHSIPAPDG